MKNGFLQDGHWVEYIDTHNAVNGTKKTTKAIKNIFGLILYLSVTLPAINKGINIPIRAMHLFLILCSSLIISGETGLFIFYNPNVEIERRQSSPAPEGRTRMTCYAADSCSTSQPGNTSTEG